MYSEPKASYLSRCVVIVGSSLILWAVIIQIAKILL